MIVILKYLQEGLLDKEFFAAVHCYQELVEIDFTRLVLVNIVDDILHLFLALKSEMIFINIDQLHNLNCPTIIGVN
jgi:hypothetical protein